MNYQEKVKLHLGESYKNKYLNEDKKGVWKRKGKEYFFSHILPKDSWKLNLLPLYREYLLDYIDKNKIKLHLYFHHLNSSQAMCLNFFYPLIKEMELDVVLKAIGIENDSIDYKSCCFEKKSEVEKRMQKKYRPTCFDFYIETKKGKKIYFEIKYTEQNFGKAKPDDIHKGKFDDVYKKNLNSIDEKYQDRCKFLENYQILRNVICVSKDSYVVFLYPNNNTTIERQANHAKSDIVKEHLKNNVINLTWEKLLCVTEENIKNENVEKQIDDFREKYINIM